MPKQNKTEGKGIKEKCSVCYGTGLVDDGNYDSDTYSRGTFCDTCNGTGKVKQQTISESNWKKEFVKDFVKLIEEYRTFGSFDDPENFEPYISFDRAYDFRNFMAKFKKLLSQTKSQIVEEILGMKKKTEVRGIPIDGHYEIVKINGYNQAVDDVVNRLRLQIKEEINKQNEEKKYPE